MVYLNLGSEELELTIAVMNKILHGVLDKLGSRNRVLVIPPDFTRLHSRAGDLTRMIWNYYGPRLACILPALGTHKPMTGQEISVMFGDTPRELFKVHDWRNDVITLGEVPAEYVMEVSENRVDFSWPAQVNRILEEGGFDLILSVGQVVPHEVTGMANYNKNIFVGTGGSEGINKSHFLGAAYGMERIMGRTETPVRKVLNYASEKFAAHLPIVYVHTVVGKTARGENVVRGLFVGDDTECFQDASSLSLKVNFEILSKPLRKAVVYLDPHEFRTAWLGNKAIYRTRLAMADDGELIILAPGLSHFGEDEQIDRLIRKYGYRSPEEIMTLVRDNQDLRLNLSAAAHLIHGSSEGRFKVVYCPGYITKKEIEQVGFAYASPVEMMRRYNPERLQNGFNDVEGEEIYYISNPALGLWAHHNRFR